MERLQNVSSIECQKEITRDVIVGKIDKIDVLSDSLNYIISNVLGIKGIKAKIYSRYLVNNLTDEEYKSALQTIFSEPPVDEVYSYDDIENLEKQGKTVLCIESLPGQYDSRVDAVKECLKLMSGNSDHKVRASTVIVLEGNISDEEIDKIKKWLINPVEKESVELDNKFLDRLFPTPEDIEIVEGFTLFNEDELSNFNKKMGFSFNFDDILLVQNYFNEEGRDPTITELKVIDTYWSDHCRHTTFNTKLNNIQVNGNGPISNDFEDTLNRLFFMRKKLLKVGPLSLMEVATIFPKFLKKFPYTNSNIKNLVVSEEVNACSFTTEVKLNDGTTEMREVQFKNETHNHPTEIEPFGGAATCIGGCVRDPMSGRSWVFQAMRISGSGDPTQSIDETIAGKLSQLVISQISALGYSSYGNQLGIHAGIVRNFFHPGYVAKHFECGFVIAGAPQENIVREKPIKGDLVLMIGGRTGRDGIGGATGSSKTHDETSIDTMGAEVQKGNPVEERKLTKLFLDPEFTVFVKRCNDFGAGGVAVAVGELAEGLDINLDVVKTKYSGLDGTELTISESQERMAIVISPEKLDFVMKIIEQYNLEAVTVAEVTSSDNNTNCKDEDKLIIRWRGSEIVNIKRSFLDMNGADRTQSRVNVEVENPIGLSISSKINTLLNDGLIGTAFLESLKDLNTTSQKGLMSIFDSSVGATNLLAPYGGKYQLSPQIGMVSYIPVSHGRETDDVTISTYGYNPDIMSENPYLGGMMAVVESVVKNVAMGGDPTTIWLTFQNYFGKLGDDPNKWGECFSALMGALKAQIKLNVPAIGGKDSMSGTYTSKDGERIDVPPTLVSFAVNKGNSDIIVSSEFKDYGDNVYYLPIPKDKHGIIDWKKLNKNLSFYHKLLRTGVVSASSVVENGSISSTIAKMCLGNNVGFSFCSDSLNSYGIHTNDIGGIIFEVDLISDDDIYSKFLYELEGLTFLGTTLARNEININDKVIIPLDEVQDCFMKSLSDVFPTTVPKPNEDLINTGSRGLTSNNLIDISGKRLSVNLLETPPKVIIPVFPGTNSEIDTFNAVFKAGMHPVLVNIRNNSESALLESINLFAESLNTASMVVFPGGFSAGDEPDGSAKYISAVCRMSILKDSLNEFFSRSDTLTLGICNGFQALIKLGVFENGYIEKYLSTNHPTLTFNHNHRHITDHVGLQVISILSPFLSLVNIGDTFVIPVSHGEGRLFLRNEDDIVRYINNGQVVLQYLDFDCNPTSSYNGSLKGVAGLCSPDGRILGLMPHPERTSSRLFKNIPGNHKLPIIRSAAVEFGVR